MDRYIDLRKTNIGTNPSENITLEDVGCRSKSARSKLETISDQIARKGEQQKIFEVNK